jgi:hypothetical protein
MAVNFLSLLQNTSEETAFKKGIFILAHDFRGLSPWLFIPVAFGPVVRHYGT